MFLKHSSSPSGIRRSPIPSSRLGSISNVAADSGHGDGVFSAGNLASESPPPPAYDYHLCVVKPTPEAAAASFSCSRLTISSIEAVRAPDSPVPEFPSPKPSSIESVFGSTHSLASLSTTPRRRSIRPNDSCTPMLRRRVGPKAVSYPNVPPVFRVSNEFDHHVAAGRRLDNPTF